MGLNERMRKEDEGESSSSYSTSSDDDENADENNNKTTTNVEEFGFERVEKLTGRRLKQEKLNKKKQKSGGFESMELPPDIFRAIKRKGYRLPTPIQRKAIPVISTGVGRGGDGEDREREDGGVCGTSFSGVAEALAEERRESVDSRADEGVGVANVRGDERYGKVYRFTVVRFSRRR